MQGKWFGEISYMESVLFIFEGIFNLEIEPLLVTLSVGIDIQI